MELPLSAEDDDSQGQTIDFFTFGMFIIGKCDLFDHIDIIDLTITLTWLLYAKPCLNPSDKIHAYTPN
jgi:hypothetical protein